jgi:SAM-dependent methyltransferase
VPDLAALVEGVRFGVRLLVLLVVAGLLAGAAILVSDPEANDLPGHYSETTPSRDGTGRIYMDREIARVMGHLGAGWLERPTREREERTDLLLDMLALAPGDTVVDLGAGTGYFSLPMARQLASGRVIAVDIQPEMLAIIEQRVEAEGISNVETLLGEPCDPGLPPATVDMVLLVDAYHEFACPKEVMQAVADSLKPEGRVILVEYRGEDPDVPIKPLHKMTVAQAKRELGAVGLVLQGVNDRLPMQHVMTFGRAN